LKDAAPSILAKPREYQLEIGMVPWIPAFGPVGGLVGAGAKAGASGLRGGAMLGAQAVTRAPTIGKIAADYVTKGVHIHVRGVELKVLPGAAGKILFKPVFSSQEKIAGPAIREAERALQDPAFRAKLLDTAKRATEYLGKNELPGAAAKSGETNFLRIALEKMGSAKKP